MFKVPEEELRLYFRTSWGQIADEGACDALDGAEYRRVYREWVDANRPVPIGRFIVIRANLPAPGFGE